MKTSLVPCAALAACLSLPLAALFAEGFQGPGQDPVQDPVPAVAPVELDGSQDCLDCHEALLQGSMIHDPVDEEMCIACHDQPDEDLHQFTTPENLANICASCHDAPEGDTVHKPVAEGHCTACHDPHHADNEHLLKQDDLEALCATCHEASPDLSQEHIHGPVDAGMCTLCHQPHASQEPMLLQTDPVSLCLSCHDDVESGLDEAENIHVPVDEDCLLCHDAHASPNEFQLLEKGSALCFQCHDGIRERTDLPVDHAAVQDEKQCMNCHLPHFSTFNSLLRQEPKELCMSCHGQAVEGDEGHELPAMQEVLDRGFVHGPIREGNCAACHDPHGSEQMAILRQAYPRTFYSGWDPSLYALCFQCHEESAFRDAETAELTSFRDGTRNLHFLHVNRERKGRTCRACHEIHASSLPAHLSEEVPYGNWKMPLNFEQTEKGGSCAPGCHGPQTYDREAPHLPLPTPSSEGVDPVEEALGQ